LSFDVVGAEDGSAYARQVIERARHVANVTVHGARSRAATASLLESALCLCCTSDIEGFPNTFLEAWSHGVPVATTYDPDGIVAAQRLGWVSTVEGLAGTLGAIAGDAGAWIQASRNSRQYYTDHHTVDAAMPRFESLFDELLQNVHG
jgi:glycosyltransferase involved in cell wall biosynthesis